MLIKLFGVLDLLIGIIFVFNYLFNKSGFFSKNLVIFAGLILLIKGLIFILTLDIASILDIISGGIVILSAFVILTPLLFTVISFFILQKGIISLIS